uniref:Secreted protein n=1 Tax=Streptomyces sp. NBC_01401 TaxID=2903854 RepID=A0AAU3GSV0_9ACTN
MIGPLTGTIAFVIVGALAIAGERTTRKRKRAFWDRYGSYEGFSSQVDEDKVRSVRGAHGDIAAVKAVRDDHPLAPLLIAKRYVEEL